MWDIMRLTIAGIAIVPILPFIITFIVHSFFSKERKKSIRMAMDVSTAFFLICVAALFNYLFNSSFGLYGILLAMLIGAGLLGNAQYRKNEIIAWKRMIRVIWRVTFFITVTLYLLLGLSALLQITFTVA